MRRLLGLSFVFSLLLPTGAAAAPENWLIPPVDGPLVKEFAEPASRYSSGHRGVDFAAEPGTAVRAAGSGTVVFAGEVAARGAVTISHGSGLTTTYSLLSEVTVRSGDVVAAGTWIGRTGSTHPGAPGGLHFGVKVGDGYVDPEAHLGPLDASGAIHLSGIDSEGGGEPEGSDCPTPDLSVPPNDNVAVAVAGIGSRTEGGVSADMYERGPELLGYPDGSIYRFSYAGADGPGFHEPYAVTDSFTDVDEAARRLGDQLREIARVHPGRGVDLIAHSQGGIVARTYLTNVASAWKPDLPQVENLVTFSSPHRGAPLAGVSKVLHGSLLGRPFLDALDVLNGLVGRPLPDPGSDAVLDLAPHSALMDALATQDIAYGTRALALGTPGDVVVPVDRSALPEEMSRVVGALGLNRHSGIVGGQEALEAAHAFLRGAPGCVDGRMRPPLPSYLIGGAQWMAGRLIDLHLGGGP